MSIKVRIRGRGKGRGQGGRRQRTGVGGGGQGAVLESALIRGLALFACFVGAGQVVFVTHRQYR